MELLQHVRSQMEFRNEVHEEPLGRREADDFFRSYFGLISNVWGTGWSAT
jgi:hypothetical protein